MNLPRIIPRCMGSRWVRCQKLDRWWGLVVWLANRLVWLVSSLCGVIRYVWQAECTLEAKLESGWLALRERYGKLPRQLLTHFSRLRNRWWPQSHPRRRAGESLGDWGERIAERQLRRDGMRIVARQARSGLGEIDLVAVDGRTVVFVEVKTRRSHEMGHPLEAITGAKQRRLCRAALAYLRRNHLLDCDARFDAVAVTVAEKADRQPTVLHLRNAFEPSDAYQLFS